ncbi:Polysaccharide biosynthesis protein [Janthinobacterium sp. KBS0711]|nr:Polysaccharide biosynthesis protein [Janthinobacterium sp. KBS0711]TSD73783.1 flippase [Janthinobacterium sp. KBS0711]
MHLNLKIHYMLIRNTLYNLLGLGLPMLVAIGSMPALIHLLGDERFGMLTLIWAVVSYFGLFDLGLGRALTLQISQLMADKRDADLPSLIYTSLLIMAALGLFAGMLMWLGADWGAAHMAGGVNTGEISGSVKVMAMAMPFIVLTSGLRGILEARGAFGIINMIRLPMGMFTFLGPLAVVLWYKNDLIAVTVALTIGRIVACLAHVYYAIRSLPGMLNDRRYRRELIRGLISSGGWMTVSNVISPLMGYMDRFLIGATISAAAVAYYVTPFEVISKLWIIPGALTAVLFPRFTGELFANGKESPTIFRKALLMLFLVIYPSALFFGIFAQDFLRLWINPEFAEKSYFLLQVFSLGIMINCMAHIPFTLIQGAGKVRVTAMIHLVQFPFFILILWLATSRYGLVGAVGAWLARMLIDAFIMFFQAANVIKMRDVIDQPLRLCGVGILILLSYLPALVGGLLTRTLLYVCCIAVMFAYIWLCIATKNERQYVLGKISSRFGGKHDL